MGTPGPAAGFGKIRHPQKRAVLLAFSHTHRLGKACEIAGVHRNLHYHWLNHDPDYKEAFTIAREMAGDMLEDVATQRAIGTQEGHSDTLLIFLLKGAKPEKYRDNIKFESELTVRLESSLQQGLSRLEVLRGERDRLSA